MTSFQVRPLPGVATQTNTYGGLAPKFHKGKDYVHIIVHIIWVMFQIMWIVLSKNLDYVSNYMDSRVSEEEQEGSHREKSGRELGLGLSSQNNLDCLQIFFVDYINYN